VRASTVLVWAVAMLGLTAACDPFGLPATRQLETGAATTLGPWSSFEVKGTYVAAGTSWAIDLQQAKPDLEHLTVTSNGQTVEAVVVGSDGYFRGQQFLAAHLAGNPLAPSLVKAAGNGWWKDTGALAPSLPDFTDGTTFRTTFLGTAVGRRTDHQVVDGADTVELSGTRADVFVASAAPYRLVRVHLKNGAVIDGIADVDFHFSNAGTDFHIAAPTNVIDFSNFSTLPPIYTVVSVDTSGCGSPCVVAAKLKNLGGTGTAVAPSTVTFTMTDPASTKVLGSCKATVQPDVGYNSTTSVSCTLGAASTNAAVVTATADNPGRGS
jgi:hypothetical protein